MSIASEIIGTHFRYPDYYLVGREKIREFAKAIQTDDPVHFSEEAAKAAGYHDLVAPLTFIAIAGRQVQLEIFRNFDVGINLARVIHRDQKIKYHRPIVAGDKLFFDSWLDSVTESHGTVISELRSEVTDEEGRPVMTTVVTMIGEANGEEDNAQIAAIAAAAMRG
ncbi:MaoC family dehydratase N-terminal domain-containing protein [Mycobacterium sp. DL592]|uniref:FAS1-like dehydratase domain-containing protein n=1 Tax=Mycobacterium sp. DL592 TaxID=2675524 RepID=UPI0014228D40|nr:MaoC family dehydratase N-terminal domain-containing protein [Mycobacterium sp. DL592]